MLLNLTYTIPPFIALGYDMQRNAIRAEDGEGFDPVSGQVTRHGTTVQRYMRGFLSGGPIRVAQNVWHVLYFLASVAMCGLGMYAAVQGYDHGPQNTTVEHADFCHFNQDDRRVPASAA